MIGALAADIAWQPARTKHDALILPSQRFLEKTSIRTKAIWATEFDQEVLWKNAIFACIEHEKDSILPA